MNPSKTWSKPPISRSNVRGSKEFDLTPPTHLVGVSLNRRQVLAQPPMGRPALVQREAQLTFSTLLALGAVNHILLQACDLLQTLVC